MWSVLAAIRKRRPSGTLTMRLIKAAWLTFPPRTRGGKRLEEGSHRTRNTSFLPLLLCLASQQSYGLHNHVTNHMIDIMRLNGLV